MAKPVGFKTSYNTEEQEPVVATAEPVVEVPSEEAVADLAEEWAELDRDFQDIKERRKEAGDKLIAILQADKAKGVRLEEGESVILTSTKSKRPTKKGMIEEFGKAGERYWSALPTSEYAYLKRDK